MFQFLIGRLATHFPQNLKTLDFEFQFLIGRLATNNSNVFRTHNLIKFQFLIGRLAT